VKIIDLNRAGGIGANSLYLEIGPFSLVVDAGINPKVVGKETMPEFDKIPARHLDAIILTHCHLDHLGSMPVLSRNFPSTPIITSQPSAILAPRMLHNSLNVMRIQREELGVREYPLYSRADITRARAQFSSPPRSKSPRRLNRGSEELTITLYGAGHVAGAASILLTYKHRKIFITGDVLFEEQWTVPGADLPREEVDTLITETTKAASDRSGSRLEEATRLLHSINATLAAGGRF
jgi:Cft2 family RNA processing exonuclease